MGCFYEVLNFHVNSVLCVGFQIQRVDLPLCVLVFCSHGSGLIFISSTVVTTPPVLSFFRIFLPHSFSFYHANSVIHFLLRIPLDLLRSVLWFLMHISHLFCWVVSSYFVSLFFFSLLEWPFFPITSSNRLLLKLLMLDSYFLLPVTDIKSFKKLWVPRVPGGAGLCSSLSHLCASFASSGLLPWGHAPMGVQPQRALPSSTAPSTGWAGCVCFVMLKKK